MSASVRERPAEKDFKAAETFLQLLYGPKKARGYSKNMAKADLAKYAARDLLRASETPVAEVQAFDWAKQRSEITAGTPMSPILLIRQEIAPCRYLLPSPIGHDCRGTMPNRHGPNGTQFGVEKLALTYRRLNSGAA